jgi:hypothetical protein
MDAAKDLLDAWRSSPAFSIKTTSYFSAYGFLFKHLRGTECTFVETGILQGGSLFMWREWLGPKARIIGIDLNPDAKKWEKSGFEIYIGDQGDPLFWREVLPKIGRIDAFLDDGGHQSFQQIVTVQEVLRYVSNDCILAVEDTYTSFMNDFCSHEENSFLEYSKDATDLLVGRSFGIYPNRFPVVINTDGIQSMKHVFNISFFNGIVAFHINSELCVEAEIIRNMKGDSIKDFRHDGKKSATIEWPNILQVTTLDVKGS